MFSPIEVFVGFALITIVIFLVRNQRFHEMADQLARRFCQRHNLQFLDGTVVFRGLHFDRRRLHFCRIFRFDYSINSVDRFAGSVTLCGEHIQSYHVHPDHLQANVVKEVVADQLEL